MAAHKAQGTPDPQAIPYPEYVLRILFSMFYPAVKMAADFNYPLDTVKDMMTLALWREAKRKHSTINVISLIFGKSTRTIKALSARFNKGGYFEETETNLTRRIEDLLSQRPMSLDELAERLPHSNEFDSTRLAVRTLLQEDRIEEVPRGAGRAPLYQAVTDHHNLYSDAEWEARIDGLGEHLEAVTETILSRFLGDEPANSAARTFTFRGRPEEVQAFTRDLFEYIRHGINELEQSAEGSDDARVYGLYSGSSPLREED